MKVIPTVIYDTSGNVVSIEFNDFAGNFQFQAQWDKRDEQTSENRDAFRKWANRMANQLGYEVEN